MAAIRVPATGIVTTPKLKQGQRYRLRASGAWATNATHGNDAFAAFEYAKQGVPIKEYQGVRLGLSVNGGTPDQWLLYNPSHVYEQSFIGTGAGFTLEYKDPEPADNSGTLLVEIFCD